jgi:hypothetical protein
LVSFGVTSSHYKPPTGYTTAFVFQIAIDAQGRISEDRIYTSGTVAGAFAVELRITEAHWIRVSVTGTDQDVLIQCFERGCLTLRTTNDPIRPVTMGIIGQDFFRWRYEELPPGAPAMHYVDIDQANVTPLHGSDFTILIDACDFQRKDVVPYLVSVGVTPPRFADRQTPARRPHQATPPSARDIHRPQSVAEGHRAHDPDLLAHHRRHPDLGPGLPRAGAGEVLTIGSLRLVVVNPSKLTCNFYEGSITERSGAIEC